MATVEVGRPPTAWLVLQSTSTSAGKHLRSRDSTVKQRETISKGLRSSFLTST